MFNIEISPMIAVLIPIVVGLTSVAKNYISIRWIPLTSIILGILGSFLLPAATVQITILSGIIVGLSACGLYSGTKTTVQG